MKAYPHGTCSPPQGALSSSSGATLTALHAVRIYYNREMVFLEDTVDNSMTLTFRFYEMVVEWNNHLRCTIHTKERKRHN